MIIHRVWSENVLKYATLELNDLPAQGLIGVSGANESGKSSIGEIICFALFGRTFAYEEHEIVSVIRWGEPSCAVSVVFSINGQGYSVSRFLDTRGDHRARLNDAHGACLARGVEPVRTALEAVLGFGFDAFIESFYLAQRDIATPHPHSTSVKKMAGIATLERIAAEAGVEMNREHAAIGEAESAMAELERRMAELDIDASRLSRLQHQRDELLTLQQQVSEQIAALQAEAEHEQEVKKHVGAVVAAFCGIEVDTPYPSWRAHVEELETRLHALPTQCRDDAPLARLLEELHAVARDARQRLSGFDRLRDSAQAYRQHLAKRLGEVDGGSERFGDTRARVQTQIRSAMASRTRVRGGGYVFLLLAFVVWAVWGLVTWMPESPVAQDVSAWLAGTLRGWEQSGKTWLLSAAVILTLGLALCGGRRLTLGARMARLQRASDKIDRQIAETRRRAEILDTLDGLPLPQAVDVLAGFEDEAVSASVLSFRQSPSADWIDAAKLDHYRAQLRCLQDRLESYVTDRGRARAARIQTIQDDMEKRQEEIDQLNACLAQEQNRHQRRHELQDSIAMYQNQMAASRHRIRVRELARDLLEHGARHMAKTFNRDLRDLVRRTLPLLTQGRYEHLKIDANLEVQVFSSEKCDFLQFDEISTGTQQQILLAVRLALSQEFINTTLGRRQFIFLDEPFAFFDGERTRSALHALPKLSRELSQIWIVAQSFPGDFAFDSHICCRQGQNVLTLTHIPSSASDS